MEASYYAQTRNRRRDLPHPAALGFPLSSAFLLVLVFGVSAAVICCYYYWDKLSFLRRSPLPVPSDLADSPGVDFGRWELNVLPQEKQNLGQSLPVLMPGDEVPKFIALPCPCRPPRSL